MAWIALMGFKAIGLSIELDFLLGIDIYICVGLIFEFNICYNWLGDFWFFKFPDHGIEPKT